MFNINLSIEVERKPDTSVVTFLILEKILISSPSYILKIMNVHPYSFFNVRQLIFFELHRKPGTLFAETNVIKMWKIVQNNQLCYEL